MRFLSFFLSVELVRAAPSAHVELPLLEEPSVCFATAAKLRCVTAKRRPDVIVWIDGRLGG